MTTQVSKSLKSKIDALADALTLAARAAQPRPGFFVEPILRVWEPEDPEGEREAQEVFYVVGDGSEEELRAFAKVVGKAFADLTRENPKLRFKVGMEAILPREVASATRPPQFY